MTNSVTEPSVGSWGLVAAAQAGDADADGEPYLRYVDQITGYLSCHVVRDRGLVADLAQETFLRASRRLDTVSGDRGRDVGAAA